MKDWESYWKAILKTGQGGQVFWDVEAEYASLEDLDRFQNYLDSKLPLLDLGCGNGRQSRFLAQHFAKVIGVDISVSAIELAKSETTKGMNIEYRVFNGVDTQNAIGLHREFGDMNVYMRGVFHMIRWCDRPNFVESLGILLGIRGVLYQIELSSESILRFRTLPEEVFAQIPRLRRRVGFNLVERTKFYPDDQWVVLDESAEVVVRSIPLPDGRIESIPANYLILQRKNSEFCE
jgi:SAM-dependent methyltransferase